MALTSNLSKIANGFDAAIDRGVYRTAEDQLELEWQLTPEDTGDLKATERIEPAEGQGDGHYEVVAGGAPGKQRKRPVNYAGFVEADQPYASAAAKNIDPAVRPAERVRRLIRKHSV